MSDNLTQAEVRAEKATELEAFPVQLREVRRSVNAILQLFGRNNIFSEYTVHDFSHVESMLRDLEWLIEEKTRDIMSPAESSEVSSFSSLWKLRERSRKSLVYSCNVENGRSLTNNQAAGTIDSI